MTQPNLAQKSAVTGGTLIVKTNDEYSGFKAATIYVSKATTITACTGKNQAGEAINFRTDTRYLWTDGEAGETLYVQDGDYIDTIQIDTGGRILVNQF